MKSDPDDSWDPYPSDEPPEDFERDDWDEDDWEEFFARQDVLNAKYQELLETLIDHPDRDHIIAREMHWDLPEDVCDDCTADEDPLLEEPGDEFGDPGDDLDAVPPYRIAQDYAVALDRDLTARLREPENDEDASRAALAAIDVSVKIAGGHGLGYDRDCLCGNIACCKRALASLAECFDGLLALRKRGLLPPQAADQFLRRGQRVGSAIAQHIEDLRRRVWWR